MIKTFIISLVFLCISVRAAQEDPAHAQLRALRDGLLAAANSGDYEGTLKFLHTNCVITWHNAEVSRGHDGVRAYFAKVMTGPTKIVESAKFAVTVDELTSLYGPMGVAFGGSDEHFKLTSGRELNVKGRWSATLIRENDRWLVLNFHASTNLFDNVLLNLARRVAIIGAVVSLFAGLIIGWLFTRRRKSPAAAG